MDNLPHDSLIYMFRSLAFTSGNILKTGNGRPVTSIPEAVYHLTTCERVCKTFKTLLCGNGDDSVWHALCAAHFPWTVTLRHSFLAIHPPRPCSSVFLALHHSSPPYSVDVFADSECCPPSHAERDALLVVACVRQWNDETKSLDVLLHETIGKLHLSDYLVDVGSDSYHIHCHRFPTDLTLSTNSSPPAEEERNVRMSRNVSTDDLSPSSPLCGDILLLRASDRACSLLCRFNLTDPGESGQLDETEYEDRYDAWFSQVVTIPVVLIGSAVCEMTFGVEVQSPLPGRTNQGRGWISTLQLDLELTNGDEVRTSSLLATRPGQVSLLNALHNCLRWK